MHCIKDLSLTLFRTKMYKCFVQHFLNNKIVNAQHFLNIWVVICEKLDQICSEIAEKTLNPLYKLKSFSHNHSACAIDRAGAVEVPPKSARWRITGNFETGNSDVKRCFCCSVYKKYKLWGGEGRGEEAGWKVWRSERGRHVCFSPLAVHWSLARRSEATCERVLLFTRPWCEIWDSAVATGPGAPAPKWRWMRVDLVVVAAVVGESACTRMILPQSRSRARGVPRGSCAPAATSALLSFCTRSSLGRKIVLQSVALWLVDFVHRWEGKGGLL